MLRILYLLRKWHVACLHGDCTECEDHDDCKKVQELVKVIEILMEENQNWG